MDGKIFNERLDLEVEGSWWKQIDDNSIGVILEICDDNSNNLIVRWTNQNIEGSRVGTYDKYEFARKWVPLVSHPEDVPVKVDSIWKSNKTGDIVKVVIEPNGGDQRVHYINLNDTIGPFKMSHVDKAVFITEHTFLRDNDNGAVYRHNRNPNIYLKVIETTEKALMGAWMRFVKYRSIKGDSVEENDGCLIVSFHSCCHLLSLDPEKEYSVPIDSTRTIKVEENKMDKISYGSLWVDVETGKDTVKVSFITSENGEVFVHYVNIVTGIERAEKLKDFVTTYKILKDNDLSAIYERRDNPSEWVQIVICNPNSTCASYHHYGGEFNGHEDENDITNFHKQYKLITFYPTDADIENMQSHGKESRTTTKEFDIKIGSIWREVRGCDLEHVGSLVKVTAIFGDIIKWVRLNVRPKDMGVLGVETHGSTCRSSFLYCFERPDRHITTPYAVCWPGAIWYHTAYGGVHVAITIKEENGTVWFVSSDNKALDLYWEMPFKKWVETYSLYDGVVKPPCFPEGCFDEMLKETEGRYERIMERLKEEEKIKANKKETYLNTDESKMKEFSSGAKREDKSGKGRYDLIPGDVMQDFEDYVEKVFTRCEGVIKSPTEIAVSSSAYFDGWQDKNNYYKFILYVTAWNFVRTPIDKDEMSYAEFREGFYEMRKALAKHYEEGAKVHGVDNWKKGLPIYGSERGGCFLDSMRRHTDQMLQRKTDEPHAVAALWNAFCALWTLKHKPHSAMYQNASAVKAEEKPRSAHFDMVDSAIDALKAMNIDKDHLSATNVITPSGKKFTIRKWPEGYEPVVDFEKEALMREMNLNYSSYNDFIKSVREADEAKRIEEYNKMILKYYDVKYNLLECIKVLRDIVTSKNFSRLNTRVTTVYFDIYSALVILYDIINWFNEDQKAIDHIAKIITDIHAMINTGVGHICSCYKIKKLEWETCPEYLRGYVCVLDDPDEDKVNILYETIGRAVNGLLNRNEKGLDPFCGLGITQSLAEFNTDCLKSRVYKK